MAIYHCSLKVFSRSEGHSAVAAAAYRSGSILKDERAGRTHRYHKRTGVADTFILAPPSAPKSLLTRAVLWNAAEASETRKNSRVAREVILALPHELSDKARAELSRDMGLYLIERYRVAVDVAIHSPCEGDGHDPRNHHAHLLFTTREVTKDGLGAKTRILDDKVSGPQEIEIIREVWETLANDALERAGFPDAKIDRRTLEAQGLDRIPQTHEGKASKNASAYQSLLAKDFKNADKGDDEDGEEESSGEKSSSSSASSGGSAHNLQSKVREDSQGRKIDYPALDKQQTRSAFNAEIKALNEKRAVLGDKPLKEQIAQLDRLMERLDKRLEKLQQLESKTTLKSVIKETIASAVKLAADFVTRRVEAKASLKLTTEEKHARVERQLTRYGRDYREGLHNQIKEMKQNIAILEQKQTDFKNYKSFVDKIDMEVKKHAPSITAPFKEQAPPKQITDKEINLKLHLKAEMIRAQIPAEFKPPAWGERQTLTNSTTVNKILQTKGEKIKIDKAELAAPEVKPITAVETPKAKPEIKLQSSKAEAPPVKSAFTIKAEAQPTPKAQAEYKQPMPVRIKALEQAIAQRQATSTETPRPEDRKSWFTPANEKTKHMTDAIDRAIKQQRAAQPSPEHPSTQTQEKFSKAQERPQRTTTYSEVREKTRAEAETKRVNVPPQYRAQAYEAKTETPKQEHGLADEPKTRTQSAFTNATEAENAPKASKPRMSDTFNMKSGFNEGSQSTPEPKQDEAPEVEI
ncbi:MAG: hypothetical protein CMF31_00955 [Kordiimonas sp.]|nr:hypothetical protein [Kordiimonas sp.]|tara:strand:- start:8020 stop:10269 length:2250 start_codon:yes stop_codon:yes gene_type:complete